MKFGFLGIERGLSWLKNSDKSELGVNLMYRMQNGESYAHSGDWIHNNGNEWPLKPQKHRKDLFLPPYKWISASRETLCTTTVFYCTTGEGFSKQNNNKSNYEYEAQWSIYILSIVLYNKWLIDKRSFKIKAAKRQKDQISREKIGKQPQIQIVSIRIQSNFKRI